MEWPAWDKHSSLLQTFVDYTRIQFYNIGPWSSGLDIFFPISQHHLGGQYYKYFYVSNLSQEVLS